MKVKELIKELKSYDQESEVWIKDQIEGNDYKLSLVKKSFVEITDISDGYEATVLK